jgi:ankyrin repeat protein
MILIQKKFQVHALNRQGLTPLLCAVINGHRHVPALFLLPKTASAKSYFSSAVKLLCSYDVSVLGACVSQMPFLL